MTASRLLGGAMAAAILATGGVALAERVPMRATPAAYDMQPISLENAVSSIERMTGGKVLEIRYQNTGGAGVYDAVVSANGRLLHGRIDAHTAHVITDSSTPDWMLGWLNRADVRSLAKTTVPLSEAIATAEQESGATAMDAGLAKPLSPQNSVLAYNVEIVRGGRPERVAVDANTNEVIRDQSLFENWAP